ncbi:MAG: radical SAM protein [Desulfobacteraceae bacterium]|nr:radical SAM protein [Desulfobacteraceae bacterium]
MSYQHIFGPVLSRRLGISLGVDLVTHKICSLDCVYCECGQTTNLTLQRSSYVTFEVVKAELDHYLEHNEEPDYITLSGSGEPTLNQDLGRVIAYIKAKRPGIRVAVLTNSTLLNDPGVRKELALADLVVPSLDAVSKEAFLKLNRPFKGLLVEDIIQGIQSFAGEFAGKIWLEIFILPGVNDTLKELGALREVILSIDPEMVQLNTLDRPGTVSHILPATKAELDRVKEILDMDIIQIIAKVADKKSMGRNRDMESAVLETIHRRPCTRDDLVAVLNADPDRMDTLLAKLEAQGQIEARQQARGVFYRTIKFWAIK